MCGLSFVSSHVCALVRKLQVCAVCFHIRVVDWVLTCVFTFGKRCWHVEESSEADSRICCVVLAAPATEKSCMLGSCGHRAALARGSSLIVGKPGGNEQGLPDV